MAHFKCLSSGHFSRERERRRAWEREKNGKFSSFGFNEMFYHILLNERYFLCVCVLHRNKAKDLVILLFQRREQHQNIILSFRSGSHLNHILSINIKWFDEKWGLEIIPLAEGAQKKPKKKKIQIFFTLEMIQPFISSIFKIQWRENGLRQKLHMLLIDPNANEMNKLTAEQRTFSGSIKIK